MVKLNIVSREEFEKIMERGKWAKNSIVAHVNDFIEANVPVMRIDYDEGSYKNAESVYNSFYNAIRRHKKNSNVKVTIIKGEVYLVNTKLLEEEKENE